MKTPECRDLLQWRLFALIGLLINMLFVTGCEKPMEDLIEPIPANVTFLLENCGGETIAVLTDLGYNGSEGNDPASDNSSRRLVQPSVGDVQHLDLSPSGAEMMPEPRARYAMKICYGAIKPTQVFIMTSSGFMVREVAESSVENFTEPLAPGRYKIVLSFEDNGSAEIPFRIVE